MKTTSGLANIQENLRSYANTSEASWQREKTKESHRQTYEIHKNSKAYYKRAIQQTIEHLGKPQEYYGTTRSKMRSHHNRARSGTICKSARNLINCIIQQSLMRRLCFFCLFVILHFQRFHLGRQVIFIENLGVHTRRGTIFFGHSNFLFALFVP